MITRIQLSSIPLIARCGCLPSERERTIALSAVIRIHLELPLGDDPARDHIENTLDYRRVLETLQAVAGSRAFALVESLAETAAVRLRQLHPAIRQVEVEIAKPGVLPDGVVPTITAFA